MMNQYGLGKATFTFLATKKSHCITQEQFEADYQTDADIATRKDLSIGEDLESFKDRIRSGIYCNDEYKESFNLCLLTPREMVKLHKREETYIRTYSNRNPDIPRTTMKNSESKKKFSKSYCWRKTCFVRHHSPPVNSAEYNENYMFYADLFN